MKNQAKVSNGWKLTSSINMSLRDKLSKGLRTTKAAELN